MASIHQGYIKAGTDLIVLVEDYALVFWCHIP